MLAVAPVAPVAPAFGRRAVANGVANGITLRLRWPWAVLPAVAVAARRRGPLGFGEAITTASEEEQAEYDEEKANEAKDEAAQRGTDPKGPDELSMARLRIWAKSQRLYKVNPGIVVNDGKLAVSMPMEAGSPLIGVLPPACLRAGDAEDREEAALHLAWRMLMEAGLVPREDTEPWPQEYLQALPRRAAQPLLWRSEEVSELQDTALQSNIQELGGRVDQWFSEKGGPDAAKETFRAAFATAFARAVRLGASWVLVPFLDAIEPMGSGVGNCKIEVEDIGQGQQLVVLSATSDLSEGAVLIEELDSSLSPAEVLMLHGTTLPMEFFTSVSVKAYVENAPSVQGLPGVLPGRLPDDFVVPGTVKPFARYEGEDGTRLDDLRAMVGDNLVSAAMAIAQELPETFVELNGRKKLRCLEELLRLLRSGRGEFATGVKEDEKLVASEKGCRRLAVSYRLAKKRALGLVVEEAEEAASRAKDGGSLPFRLR